MVFGRPFPERFPSEWFEPNALGDRRRDERRDRRSLPPPVGPRRREALVFDATGLVPWWPEDRREPTLHAVAVHVLADLHRHAGDADILREQIDGGVGMLPDLPFPPDWDEGWRPAGPRTAVS